MLSIRGHLCIHTGTFNFVKFYFTFFWVMLPRFSDKPANSIRSTYLNRICRKYRKELAALDSWRTASLPNLLFTIETDNQIFRKKMPEQFGNHLRRKFIDGNCRFHLEETAKSNQNPTEKNCLFSNRSNKKNKRKHTSHVGYRPFFSKSWSLESVTQSKQDISRTYRTPDDSRICGRLCIAVK